MKSCSGSSTTVIWAAPKRSPLPRPWISSHRGTLGHSPALPSHLDNNGLQLPGSTFIQDGALPACWSWSGPCSQYGMSFLDLYRKLKTRLHWSTYQWDHPHTLPFTSGYGGKMKYLRAYRRFLSNVCVIFFPLLDYFVSWSSWLLLPLYRGLTFEFTTEAFINLWSFPTRRLEVNLYKPRFIFCSGTNVNISQMLLLV